MENKYQEYQEALNEIKEFVHSELDGTRMLDGYLKYCDTLQELVDKETPIEERKELMDKAYSNCYAVHINGNCPYNNQNIFTLEEVKKEWEENKWKVSEDEYFKTITFIKGENGIEFSIKDKNYFTFQKELEHNSFGIDCKLHDLITKTIKALERYDYD